MKQVVEGQKEDVAWSEDPTFASTGAATVAGGLPPGDAAPGGDDGDEGRPRRGYWLILGGLLAGLLVGAAVALSGGGPAPGEASVAAETRASTTPTTAPTTTATTTTTTTTTAPAAAWSGPPSTTPVTRHTRGGGPTTTTTTTTTVAVQPRPAFTSSSASPATVTCEGSPVPITVSWTTTNADYVTVDGSGVHPPNGSAGATVCPDDTVELRAVGSAGDTRATVVVSFLAPPPPAP